MDRHICLCCVALLASSCPRGPIVGALRSQSEESIDQRIAEETKVSELTYETTHQKITDAAANERLALNTSFIEPDSEWFWHMGRQEFHVGNRTIVSYNLVGTLRDREKWPEQLKQCRLPTQTLDENRALRFTRYIASGAEGCVFLAEDADGGRAAVKMQKKSDSREWEVMTHLDNAKPRSRHIVHFAPGFEQTQVCCGVPCLVTEFVNGTTLTDLMELHGIAYKNSYVTQDLVDRTPEALANLTSNLPFAELRHIILQSLVSFRDVERAGVCNGDQNLRNIMLEHGTGRIVFIDCGNARTMDPAHKRCPPSYFEPDHVSCTFLGGGGRSCTVPQAFPTLGYLLRDDADAAAYQRLCSRLRRDYTSSAEALIGEVLQPPGSTASADGKNFFGLHPDAAFEAHKAAEDLGGEDNSAATRLISHGLICVVISNLVL